MKNFLQYLQESQKTYEFRIKLANIDPTDSIDQLKNALDSYGLESLSNIKRLPIKDNDIDFPSYRNCQIYLIDAVLKYPVNDATLRSIIADRAGYSASSIVVVPTNHPEEQRRWDLPGNDVREFKKGESVLDKPYENNPEATAAGKQYAEAGSILKDLNTPNKFVIAGNDNTVGGDINPAHGKTLQQVSADNKSPVGSKQNKIPNATKGLA